MKIRTGFVSNSSSSSFLTVGIEDKDIYLDILKRKGIFVDDDQYSICGELKVSDLERYGYGSYQLGNDLIAFNGMTPEYTTVGLVNIDEFLEDGLNLLDIKEIFQKKIFDSYRIVVNTGDISLINGEESNES